MALNPDLIAGVIAFLFTLMIFSYLIGDNPLFRIAIYIFIGVSAGYVAVVAFWQVLWPDLIVPLMRGASTQRAILLVPLVLSGLLLMKAWPSLSRLGMPAMGLMVGVGAAVALGGAVVGTMLPQVNATISGFAPSNFTSLEAPFNALVVLGGVIATLVYFHFGARTTAEGAVRRFQAIEVVAVIGSVFVAIALGVLFAGVYSAALTALVERLHFLGSFFGF
jgi:hypothetical protein